MAKLLALEWGLREARVAVARTQGGSIVVEHAFGVDLGPRDPGQTFSDDTIGGKLAPALASRGIGRTETLVAVGRASIELRQLALPPCPLEELPDLVRFQALRQFTTIGEDWPIDFVYLDTAEDNTFSVSRCDLAGHGLADQLHLPIGGHFHTQAYGAACVLCRVAIASTRSRCPAALSHDGRSVGRRS